MGGKYRQLDETCCGYKISHKKFEIFEWILGNLGSLLFVLGNVFFSPHLTLPPRPRYNGNNGYNASDQDDLVPGMDLARPFNKAGALKFAVGSFLFLIVSISIAFRNKAHRCMDKGSFGRGVVRYNLTTKTLDG